MRGTALIYRGRQKKCPVCEIGLRRFASFQGRPTAQCPRCGSLERQRALWLALEAVRQTQEQLKLLHFAPEPFLARALSANPRIDYVSADLEPGVAMLEIDITAIPFDEASIDVVLVSHVLEHVPDDRKAMRELVRILKPNGFALLQHPILPNLAETYEDESIVDPGERLRAFGQDDHVRIYGADFQDRLEASGFKVTARQIETELGPDLREKYGLTERPPAMAGTKVYVARPNLD